VLIANQLDAERAVEVLKPELRPFEKAELAQKLDSDPHVQEEVQSQLAKRGLDSASRDHLVDLLWADAEATDPRRERAMLQARNLLAKALLPDLSEPAEEPLTLRISGLEAGLARMLSDENADAQSGEGFSKPAFGARSSLDAEFDS
jgi:hypothetical protein